MPIADIVTNNDEPPYEIKGRGTPVKGTSATFEAKLNNICSDKRPTIPMANIFP